LVVVSRRTQELQVRAARPDEREALEALQRRASEHSGTYREQLRAHPDAIVLPVEQIEQGLVLVAEDRAGIAGFSAILTPRDGACELDGLFVEPDRWRAGIGRRLVEGAAALARDGGANRMEVTANPDARGFYARLGFVAGAEVPTRFGPGRRMSRPLGP
jgi:GNAT superfamily N-acetyltransferase